MARHDHSANFVPAPQDESPSKPQPLGALSLFPWLREVRSKIWSRKNLERELFRTVEVTQAHYDELQRRLKELHPDRDTREYDGRRHDVGSVKLDVLRLTLPTNSPRHPDNNEDRVDDDDALEASDDEESEMVVDEPETSDDEEPEMVVDEPEASNDGGSESETTFPFTLHFLDLSSLGLRTDVSRRLPLPVLYRPEYNHISTLIKAEPRNGHGSVIVSGQPGIGEVLVSLSHRI